MDRPRALLDRRRRSEMGSGTFSYARKMNLIPFSVPFVRDPTPAHRRNEPMYLKHIVEELARDRGEPVEVAAAAATTTSRAFFILAAAGRRASRARAVTQSFNAT